MWRSRKLIVCATITLSALWILIDLLVACTAQPGSVTEPATPTTQPSTPEFKLLYVVVDTGQDKCYDNSREITCPQTSEAFYGQDAQHQGFHPAYQDNGDGTITDLNTGLMWQQTPGNKVTYDEAVAGAENFNLAGYDDWRLPTIRELYSLILFSGTEVNPEGVEPAIPFIDTNYFDFEYGDISASERIIDAQYWSSTEYVGTTMNGAATVFGVNFADGRIKGYPKDIGPQGQPMTEFVRYVRGNLDYGVSNFIDNGDGTITDNATGLMWSKADSSEGMDWEGALAWVQQKNEENYLGYNDWRLPNAKELQSIVDYTRSPQTTNSAAIDPVFKVTSIIDEGGQTNYSFYWTSTTHVNASGGGTAMENAGIPRDRGPIGVMLREHEVGRSYVRNMSEAVEKYKTSEPTYSSQFAENAEKYVELLTQHIDKEDNILYPMADMQLSEEKQRELIEKFEELERERVGIGKHEELHELLHHLEDKYLK